jgi:tetratricopeptide (TPR) repeat protein
MTSTLIIRDAALAIHGSPELRADPAQHLRSRIAEVQAFQEQFLGECLDVLGGVAVESADGEILEAVLIASIARPELANPRGLTAIPVGRHLAAYHEKAGNSDRAMATLELLVEVFPGHKALERDLAGLMRRQGMVTELVERYLQRSKQLLKQRRTSEAIGWMREALKLDRSRKDVARTIRDLRYKEIDKVAVKRSRRRVAIVTLTVSLLLATAVLREVRLAEEFRTLPEASAGDVVGMRERLAALETFMSRHPIWHGSLDVITERTALRLETERIVESQELAAARREQDEDRRLEDAQLAYKRGTLLAHDGHYAAALEELRHSLELAPPQWEEREDVQRDIDAISAYLEEQK